MAVKLLSLPVALLPDFGQEGLINTWRQEGRLLPGIHENCFGQKTLSFVLREDDHTHIVYKVHNFSDREDLEPINVRPDEIKDLHLQDVSERCFVFNVHGTWWVVQWFGGGNEEGLLPYEIHTLHCFREGSDAEGSWKLNPAWDRNLPLSDQSKGRVEQVLRTEQNALRKFLKRLAANKKFVQDFADEELSSEEIDVRYRKRQERVSTEAQVEELHQKGLEAAIQTDEEHELEVVLQRLAAREGGEDE